MESTHSSQRTVESLEQVSSLDGPLKALLAEQNDLEKAMARLRVRARKPYETLTDRLREGQAARRTSAMLGRVSRFLRLSLRLSQGGEPLLQSFDLSNEDQWYELAEVAVTLSSMEQLVQNGGISGIEVAEEGIIQTKTLKAKLLQHTEALMDLGRESHSQLALGAALRIHQALGNLASEVQQRVDEQQRAMQTDMSSALDANAIFRDARARAGMRERRAMEVTILWEKIEHLLLQRMTLHVNQVDELERAMKNSKGISADESLLHQVLETMDEAPSRLFWKQVVLMFQHNLHRSIKASGFLQDHLAGGYPRLLKLVHSFLLQSCSYPGLAQASLLRTPEAVFFRRTLQPLEDAYVKALCAQLDELVTRILPPNTAPTKGDISHLIHTLSRELSAVRFDEALQHRVAGFVGDAIRAYATRSVASLQAPEAFQIGRGLCTPPCRLNIDLANASNVFLEMMVPPLTENPLVVEPLDRALEVFQDALEAVVHKMLRQPFGSQVRKDEEGDPVYSLIIRELCRKLVHLNKEFLARFTHQASGDSPPLGQILARHAVDYYTRALCLLSPVSASVQEQVGLDTDQFHRVLTSLIATPGSEETWDLERALNKLQHIRKVMMSTTPEDLLREGEVEEEGKGRYLDDWHLAHLLIARSYPDLDLPWRMSDAPSVPEYLAMVREADAKGEDVPAEALDGAKACLKRWKKASPRQNGKDGYASSLSTLLSSL
ncbi:hypothetical protein BJ684DRAFT_18872 [Piptocephalis cylindrospora]|uniref:Conserved oligomeric Golgi complex subunit 5 helical domain-containing protein n=1 Tax=Piptocephalis cylindrospora TaxID=1907219 RepID=A0A4P9Y8Q8_9FUNG|nr:hypothetical protein BJ684DRAFT_18872 [Piptocephalis cylindrospora]|eukprot:RKP14751.1 hypothetical protein BJ684DRAFT_18872 [Piptocephalis cylindrospora]